jgi:hypothetical protein
MTFLQKTRPIPYPLHTPEFLIIDFTDNLIYSNYSLFSLNLYIKVF